MTDPYQDDLRRVQEELHRLNQHRFIRIHDSLIQLLVFNFARGLAFGLGTVLGASLLISMLVWALSQIDFIPVIGDWAQQIIQEIDRQP